MPGINRRVATPEEITIGLGQSKDVGVSGASGYKEVPFICIGGHMPDHAEYFRSILGPEIKEERARQDEQWGGPAHDDKHDLVDWLNTRWGIPRFVDRAVIAAGSTRLKYELGDASGIKYDPTERFEKAMISIAALAIAAVQSSRRKRNV